MEIVPKKLQMSLRSFVWSADKIRVEHHGSHIQFHALKKNAIEDTEANAHLLADWLREKCKYIDFRALDYQSFDTIRHFIDDIEEYIITRRITGKEKDLLRAKLACLRLGMRMPLEALTSEKGESLFRFIRINNFDKKCLSLRIQLNYTHEGGLYLPIEGEGESVRYIPFHNINCKEMKNESGQVDQIHFRYRGETLFRTDKEFKLLPSYSLLRSGIAPYGERISEIWRPFDKRDPRDWGNQCKVDVLCYWERKDPPSLYRNTHTFIELYDDNGDIRSAGQDMVQEVVGCRFSEIMSTKHGYQKIESPDNAFWYSTSNRIWKRISIPLSKEEHDRLVLVVETDKADKERVMHLTVGNCVSWTMKVLRKSIGLKVDGGYHFVLVFLREKLRIKWVNRMILFCHRKQRNWPRPIKQLMLFFPPYFLVVIVGSIAVRLAAMKNYKERKIRFWDLLLRPSEAVVHHPIKIYEALSEMADENGVIQR